MPGTIQVSILELIGLPSVSVSSSTVIKVSLGKQALETSVEKGDFSFPLTTLRDNLVVKIHDNEGNELAHTGVQTRLIVEKGTWDDVFPLEGGGQVHMRLIFLLNDDERHRIRKMRESASRKKQEEYPKKELENSELSLPAHDSKTHVDEQAVMAYGGSSPELVSIPCLDETHQSHTDIKEEPFYNEASTTSDPADSMDSVGELGISSEASQNVQRSDVVEESSLEEASSNIRKMIVAFESTLSKLEMEPDKGSSIMKSELTGTTSEKSEIQPVYMELENTEEIHTHPEPEPYPPSTTTRAVDVVEELKSDIHPFGTELKNTEVQTHGEQESDPSTTAVFTEEEILTHEATVQESSISDTEEFTCQSHDQSYNEDESPINAGDGHNLEQRSLGESGKSSSSETNELLGPSDHVVSGETHCSESLAKEDRCPDICITGSNNHQLPHDVVNSSEVPDEAECVTTSGLVEEIPIEAGACPGAGDAIKIAIDRTPFSELSSENHQQIFSESTAPEVDIPGRVKKPEPVGDSKGSMGQAIKIAVIIGFGLFFILSTQRRSR
ncbi:hypothetical protein AKJ16_DCAP08217 [Drosera capensis]